MPFDFLEIEDNFVPDVVSDPYNRRHIRTRYTLKVGESMSQAEDTVHAYIKDYIQKNTVDNPHMVERIIPDELLPVVQYEPHADKYPTYTEQTLEEQIRSCTELPVLKAYQLLVKKDPILQQAYNETMDKIK